MLPAHRVIGHKEYAAGRKVDPIYDMNWRRNSVANFKPKTTQSIPEDDMPNYTQWAQADKNNLVSDILNFPLLRNKDKQMVSLSTVLNVLELKEDGYGRRIEQTQAAVATVQGLLEQLAQRQGMTPAEIEALVTRLMRENVVKVDVDVKPGGGA